MRNEDPALVASTDCDMGANTAPRLGSNAGDCKAQNRRAEDRRVASEAAATARNSRFAFGLKWVASIIQIGGYTATAFGATPLNIYLFIAGLTGWLWVGALWRDRAIILIHLVALTAMLAGATT